MIYPDPIPDGVPTYQEAVRKKEAHDRYAAEIERRFQLHPPKSPEIGRRMDEVRAWYTALALDLEKLPESREKSLALTHLEESLFQAIASIARSPENL